MNISGLLDEVGDLVAHCEGSVKDAQILRYANRAMQSLMRYQVEHSDGYYNCEIHLHPDDFTEIHRGFWETHLPEWTVRITDVYILGTGTEELFTPYESDNPNNIHSQVGPSRRSDRRFGWEFTRNKGFAVRQASPDSLRFKLRVAKLPASLASFTIDERAFDDEGFYLPVTPTLGVYEITRGAYINTAFQVTSSAAQDQTQVYRPILGEIRTCQDSDPNFITENGARKTRILLSSPFNFPLIEGDTLESVVELPGEHCRLLVLSIAEMIFQRRNNTDALRSIRDELAREFQAFVRYASPRDNQFPSIARRSPIRDRASYRRDPDRDWWYSRFN